ncbi:crotonase/enoyl-CoA hydratase family protein [Paraburkholderia solisilvae]|uniref:Short-chain-enoyl-CoA hydratase n=1 Tax=Paraburkholderia solisilvae TaxID=624376 RepID=A0A6J5DEI8_9BURK|nr:crotonase/enoyl-CoA hydratase family protein [Paraburkholderia solisilvae]CAB3751681.1 Short-chain-enoyl-CoA hydratase [Paraburkholderia solisilvae]
MTYLNDAARRGFLKTAAVLGGTAALGVPPLAAGADELPPSDIAVTTVKDTPSNSGAKLTVERRGPIVLFGLNRPDVQNRVDPDTFKELAEAYYNYDHDPSLRAAVLFGHGDNFSRGIDIDGFRSLGGKPPISEATAINPLATTPGPRLTKPLVVAVHGDTWNMGHELLLVADIRVASADTRFAQDENTHGRFPGGGSTVRFVREAGWGNAMRYILTGDHWSAEEAHRMGEVQIVAADAKAALETAIQLANKIANCAPLGIKTTLASAHLAIDPAEQEALFKLTAQYRELFQTHDFLEGRRAEIEGRRPVYEGK